MKHLPAEKHGAIEPLFDGIWLVRGASKLPTRLPLRTTKTMTILRGAGGELTLVNAMRLSDAALAELEALGRVAHVITLGAFHGKDDGFYRERYGAVIHALEGHVYTRSATAREGDEGYLEPDVRLGRGSPLPVDGRIHPLRSSRLPEALLLLRHEGGIIVSADALQNMPTPDRYTSWLGRIALKRMGFFAPCNVGPGWRSACTPSRAELRAILDLEFQHVIPGHGDPVVGDARERYRATLESELPDTEP